jgi:hypothetical protein
MYRRQRQTESVSTLSNGEVSARRNEDRRRSERKGSDQHQKAESG